MGESIVLVRVGSLTSFEYRIVLATVPYLRKKQILLELQLQGRAVLSDPKPFRGYSPKMCNTPTETRGYAVTHLHHVADVGFD